MQTIVIVILFALTIANSLFIYLVFRQIQRVVHDIDRKMHELHVDTKLAEAFDSTDMHDISALITDLSVRVKRRYGLKAKTYSDLVTELRGVPHVDEKLRTGLIDFFERITVISYKEEQMSEQEKSRLKQEYKVIMRMFQPK